MSEQWFSEINYSFLNILLFRHPGIWRGCHGRDHMVVGFTTTYAISAYHHECCEFELHWGRGLLDTTLGDKDCHWLVAGQWFSPCTLVSSNNKIDCHEITEILLKVELNSITLSKTVAFNNWRRWNQQVSSISMENLNFIFIII